MTNNNREPNWDGIKDLPLSIDEFSELFYAASEKQRQIGWGIKKPMINLLSTDDDIEKIIEQKIFRMLSKRRNQLLCSFFLNAAKGAFVIFALVGFLFLINILLK